MPGAAGKRLGQFRKRSGPREPFVGVLSPVGGVLSVAIVLSAGTSRSARSARGTRSTG